VAQETLVNKWIEDGWSLAVRFHREISPVENLFWAHSTEASKWYLFFMTVAVDEKGIGNAYRDLLAVYDKMPQMAFSKFDLKLVRPKDEIGVWLRFQHHLIDKQCTLVLGNGAIRMLRAPLVRGWSMLASRSTRLAARAATPIHYGLGCGGLVIAAIVAIGAVVFSLPP
jgi:hypothetical protein